MSADIQTYTAIEEINGVTYEGWTVWWWHWAIQGPKETNPVYDKTGNNANRRQPRGRKVMMLAGTFDREPTKFTRRIRIKSDMSILIPIVNSNISKEEHDKYFNQSNSNAQVMTAVDEVITDAKGSLRIETGGSSVDYNIGDSSNIAPVRIRPNSGMSPMFPGQGIIQSQSGQEVDFMFSAMDGYWVFLKPLKPGQYTIAIRGDAPWFGGEKDEPRFVTDVTYDVDVAP